MLSLILLKQHLLGHRDGRMTQRYAHLRLENLRAAVKTINWPEGGHKNGHSWNEKGVSRQSDNVLKYQSRNVLKGGDNISLFKGGNRGRRGHYQDEFKGAFEAQGGA